MVSIEASFNLAMAYSVQIVGVVPQVELQAFTTALQTIYESEMDMGKLTTLSLTDISYIIV